MGLTKQDPGCCCGGCSATIHVICNTTNLVGASVVITDSPGGGAVASGSTVTGGVFGFTLPGNGYYNVSVTASGHPSFSSTFFISCGQTVIVNVCCPVTADASLCPNAPVLSGIPITVVATSSGSTLASGITNVHGYLPFTFPTGTPVQVTVTASPYSAIYQGCTVTATPSCNGFVGCTEQPASGYVCDPCCGTPVNETLTLNDGIGDVTLTETDTVPGFCSSAGGEVWTGCAIRTFTAISCTDIAGTHTVDLPVFFCAQCIGAGGSGDWQVQAAVLTGIGAPPFCLFTSCTGTIPPLSAYGVLWSISAPPVSCVPFDFSGSESLAPGTLGFAVYGASVSVTVMG